MPVSIEVQQSTYEGQASWADPATCNTCRECRFWSVTDERVARSRYDYFGKHELKPRRCALARRLNHEITTAVPHYAQACSQFQANPEPPPVWAKHMRRDS